MPQRAPAARRWRQRQQRRWGVRAEPV